MAAQAHRQKRLRELQGESEEGTSAPGADEDAEREAWLAQIHLAALRSHDLLDITQQVRPCAAAWAASCLVRCPAVRSSDVRADKWEFPKKSLPIATTGNAREQAEEKL